MGFSLAVFSREFISFAYDVLAKDPLVQNSTTIIFFHTFKALNNAIVINASSKYFESKTFTMKFVIIFLLIVCSVCFNL